MTQNKINVIELIQKFFFRQINRSYFRRSECLLGIRDTDEKRRKSFVRECLDTIRTPRRDHDVVDIQVGSYQKLAFYGHQYSHT